MSDNEPLSESLLALELRLLDPNLRGDRVLLDDLLADDFREVGRSGRAYDKDSVIAALELAPGFNGPRTIVDFHVADQTRDTALVTYRCPESATHRCSYWRRVNGRWRLAYHQGTAYETR